MHTSRQQKCGLAFASISCLVIGGAIIVCGVLFDVFDPYTNEKVNNKASYEYYYTQYWLGIPLFVLGVLVLCFLCLKIKPLIVLCVILSFCTLTLSIAAVVLEGPKWRNWITIRRYIVDKNIENDQNGICHSPKLDKWHFELFDLALSCREVYYVTLMQSVMVVCSIMAISLTQFIIFVSLRALGWMSQASYDVTQKNNHVNYGSSTKF